MYYGAPLGGPPVVDLDGAVTVAGRGDTLSHSSW